MFFADNQWTNDGIPSIINDPLNKLHSYEKFICIEDLQVEFLTYVWNLAQIFIMMSPFINNLIQSNR